MPARLCDIARAGKTLGLRFENPRKGSHFKVYRPGYRMYPIPAHNGDRTEISDKYIRDMCRSLGIDEAELRALL